MISISRNHTKRTSIVHRWPAVEPQVRMRPLTAMQRWVGIQVSPPVKLIATSTPFLPVAAHTAFEKSPVETMAWSAPRAFSFAAFSSLLVMA